MDRLSATWSAEDANFLLDDYLSGTLFVLGIAYFVFEVARYVYLKRMNWRLVSDSIANALTFLAYPFMSWLLGGAFFIGVFFVVYENWAPVQIPINVYSIVAAVILADFIYYWEHRFMHRTGIGWMTHTVHHSSPEFNVSVAYRFGPLDGFFPWFFHLPLALLGFHPLVIFGAEVLVQAYQAILHTEAIPKLGRRIEAIFNTPSHHRVHHGSNPQYHDKNYGGILIIWDRLFGTFEPEIEPVRYGITKPINSVNPFVVFFHGIARFLYGFRHVRSLSEAVGLLFRPPGWKPDPTNRG